MPTTVLRIITAAIAGLLITSCGGGGGEEVAPSQSSLATVEARGKPGAQDQTLFAGPVSVVNSTTEGNQVLRAIGATSDGGYTVAWMSDDSTLFMQHYDSRGTKDGPQMLIALTLPPTNAPAPAEVIRSSALAVLTDGSVVVTYVDSRPTQGADGVIYRTGLFLQRFDAAGAQILPEIRVSSQEGLPPPARGDVLDMVKAIPLSDGGFVVGWTLVSIGGSLSNYRLWLQRFDARAQPVGERVAAGNFLNLRYEITPDRVGGGLTLSTSSLGSDSSGGFPPISSSTHFDAAMVAQPGGSGELELADGTHVVVSRTFSNFTVERFSATGALLGSPVVIRTSVRSFEQDPFRIVPLVDSGFALAWNAQSVTDDTDVFTQAYLESERDRKKACREAAKDQKLRGKQRQAFIQTCSA